jgi:hypothetical protein
VPGLDERDVQDPGRTGSRGIGTQVASLDPYVGMQHEQTTPIDPTVPVSPPPSLAPPTVTPPTVTPPANPFDINPYPSLIGPPQNQTQSRGTQVAQGAIPGVIENTYEIAPPANFDERWGGMPTTTPATAPNQGFGEPSWDFGAPPAAPATPSNLGNPAASLSIGDMVAAGFGISPAAAATPGERSGQPSFGPQSDPFAGAQTTPATPDPGFGAPQSERSTISNTPLGDLGVAELAAEPTGGWSMGAQGYGYGIGQGNQGFNAMGSPSAGIGFSDWGGPPAGTPTAVAYAMDENQSPVAMAAPADARGAFSMGLGAQGLADYYSALAGYASRGWGGTMTGTHAGRHAEGGPVERPSGIASYDPQPPPLPPREEGPRPLGLSDVLDALRRYGYEGGVLTGGRSRGRHAAGGIVGNSIKRFVDVSPSSAAGQIDQNPMIGAGLAQTFSPSQLAAMFDQIGHNRRDQNPPQGEDNNKSPQQLQISIPGATGGGSFTGMAEGGYVTGPGYYAPGGLTQSGMHTLGTQAHYSGANVKPAIKQPGVHLMSSSSIPGRTDRIPMRAKPGSYVLPADVVSGLGQGNTMAGAKMWGQAIMAAAGPAGAGTMGALRRGTMPKASVPAGIRRGSTKGFAEGGNIGHNGGLPMDDEYVPIVTAGGEVLVDPELVEALGYGSEMLGKRKLAESVLSVREQTIKNLKKLPRPVA